MVQHPAIPVRTGEAAPRGMDQRQADLRRFRRDVDYYAEHREALLARHSELWVAIFDRELVGVAADPRALVAALKKRRLPAMTSASTAGPPSSSRGRPTRTS